MERERIAWLSLALLSALAFVLVRPLLHTAPALPAGLVSDNRIALGVAIDLNLASATELEAIPGIGPTRAAAIVEDRDRHGAFANVDALERVKGIGPATIDAIRFFVRALPPPREEGEVARSAGGGVDGQLLLMPRSPKMIARARALRREMTDIERGLWRHLRGHRLEGHEFRRQHPVGPYVLDFYCPATKLCVEVDGSGHLDQAARCSSNRVAVATRNSRASILERRGQQ